MVEQTVHEWRDCRNEESVQFRFHAWASSGESVTPSGPVDNEEDREDVDIISPSQPATSSQPEQNVEPETKRPRRHVSLQWIHKRLKTYSYARGFNSTEVSTCAHSLLFAINSTFHSFSVCVSNRFIFFFLSLLISHANPPPPPTHTHMRFVAFI